MHRKTLRLSILFILAFIHTHAGSQDSTRTKIYVIGVVHSATKYRNSDSLLAILKDIRPDLILSETDTLSGYFKPGNVLVSPPGWYRFARKMGLAPSMPPELEVLHRYQKHEPGVKIYPFDIAIPNRKRYAQEEQDWLLALEKAHADQNLPRELDSTYNAYMKLFDLYEHMLKMTYRQLNRRSLTDSVREHVKKDELLARKLAKDAAALASYQDQLTLHYMNWQSRNDVMVKNIIRITNKTRARRVVVFTGLLHKYHLLDQLAGHGQFDLKEYYE